MVQIQVLESIMNLMRNDEMITMMSLFLPSVTGMPDFIFCFLSQFIMLLFLNYYNTKNQVKELYDGRIYSLFRLFNHIKIKL